MKKKLFSTREYILSEFEKNTVEGSLPSPLTGVSTPCLLWTGYSYNTARKPRIDLRGFIHLVKEDGLNKRYLVYRESYELHVRKLLSEELVLHSCGNSLCLRPDHLYVGSVRDNAFDTVKHGNNVNYMKTVCKHGHEYTIENTYYSGDQLQNRQCRTCRKRTMLAYDQKHSLTKAG